jgi:DNA-binding winged helix-turn-helix (wHTH) protein
MRAVFGDCVFDSQTRQVFRLEQPVHLSPKAFRLLEMLLEGRPRAFSKAEIHEKIWPAAFVSEVTLASLVAEIREAIGEHAKDARFIRTVHGFGYAFAGTANEIGESPVASESRWRVIWNEQAIPLVEGETILGREHSCQIRMEGANVSRRHARIVISGDEATVEDLGSKNGVYVGSKRISEAESLQDGDSIRIGRATLTVRRAVSDENATETEIETSAVPSSARRRPRPTRRPARR